MSAGFRGWEASGVAEGINAIQKFRPDLIILDINLGDGTGLDFLHALPNIGFNVIFISASDKQSIQAFRLSGVEYLLKPVNLEELIAAVIRVEETENRVIDLQIKEQDTKRT